MLTDVACRRAQPGPKNRKLAAGGGLFLLVKTTGTKSWRWKFRFGGKEKQLTIGQYPAVSLAEAKKARDRARGLLDEGVDPSAVKQRRKAQAAADAANSFKAVALAWYATKEASWEPRYAAQIKSRLENNVFPKLGHRPIREIEAPDVLDVIRAIEKRDRLEMAHRVRMHMSDVFVWAIASGLAAQDPAAVIRKALRPTNAKLRPARLKVKEARGVLELSEKQPDIHWATRLASRLLALTAARPGVVRLAERSEFEDLDSDQPIWRIPAAKMKLSRERKRDASFEFVVPLSPQAVEVVKAALSQSTSKTWLFPSERDPRKAISVNTLGKHYRDIGLGGKHTPHGWRSSFSTIMNEQAAVAGDERDRAIIDLMLAHVPEGVEAAYNRAAYMPRRRELAQQWADMLMKGMPAPSALVPSPAPEPGREAAHDGRRRKVVRR